MIRLIFNFTSTCIHICNYATNQGDYFPYFAVERCIHHRAQYSKNKEQHGWRHGGADLPRLPWTYEVWFCSQESTHKTLDKYTLLQSILWGKGRSVSSERTHPPLGPDTVVLKMNRLCAWGSIGFRFSFVVIKTYIYPVQKCHLKCNWAYIWIVVLQMLLCIYSVHIHIHM